MNRCILALKQKAVTTCWSVGLSVTLSLLSNLTHLQFGDELGPTVNGFRGDFRPEFAVDIVRGDRLGNFLVLREVLEIVLV